MGKYNYTNFEKQINTVLAHQSSELSNVQFPDIKSIDSCISSSEDLLRKLGYSIDNLHTVSCTQKQKVMVVPTWEELCLEAERHVGTEYELEDIFTAEELKDNSDAVRRLNDEYSDLHILDKYDVAISAFAGLVSAAVDILLVGIPQKGPTGLSAGTLSNYVRAYFEKKFPEDTMQKLANSKVSKVPFDAQDNRNTTEYVQGLSAYYGYFCRVLY